MTARFRNSPRIPALLAPALVALATVLGLPATAAGHQFDHAPPAFTTGIPSTAFIAGGPGASWELLKTFPTGNPHTDLDFFTQRGETYAAVGTLAIGPNGGGQTIVKLTQNGEVTPTSPQFVSSHPSASCVSDPSAATGLQHDVEATPKGNVILNTFNREASRRDAQLLLDATDAEGRCHDATAFGLDPNDPQGGLELVDITNLADPVEIGLTSHIGESHTVNVDPKRPHIAYAVTSDFVTVSCNADDTNCKRRDEDTDPATTQGFNLDGFEVVDLSSCMNFLPLTTVAVKRMVCQPRVYRYRWPSALTGLGHTNDSLAGCHELEIYPDDKLVCAGVNATMYFDMSRAFDSQGRPRGTPLPCRLRPSATPAFPYGTAAMVTDCVSGQGGQDLRIEGWRSIGSPSLSGVRFLGAAYHQGRRGNDPPQLDATQDVEISHESELSGSGRLILTTDERGGGVLPPGAACVTSPADNPAGNGGIHAYRVNSLLSNSPSGSDAAAAAAAHTSYALTPSGGKAIFRVPIETGPQASLCTAHLFHQIPGQNRIFMGWYSQGTQVVDFVEHPNGRVSFSRAGFFIPANANTWTSAVFKVQRNHNGSFTYWGATGDFNLGLAGRSAIDVYKVTLPAPPRPRGHGFEDAPSGCEDADDDDHVDFHQQGPTTASRGSTVQYTLLYANLSANDDVECPEIDDDLDFDLEFISASNGGSYDPETHSVNWELGRLVPGATGIVTVTARVSPSASIGSVIANQARLNEPGMVEASASFQTIVLP